LREATGSPINKFTKMSSVHPTNGDPASKDDPPLEDTRGSIFSGRAGAIVAAVRNPYKRPRAWEQPINPGDPRLPPPTKHQQQQVVQQKLRGIRDEPLGGAPTLKIAANRRPQNPYQRRERIPAASASSANFPSVKEVNEEKVLKSEVSYEKEIDWNAALSIIDNARPAQSLVKPTQRKIYQSTSTSNYDVVGIDWSAVDVEKGGLSNFEKSSSMEQDLVTEAISAPVLEMPQSAPKTDRSISPVDISGVFSAPGSERVPSASSRSLLTTYADATPVQSLPALPPQLLYSPEKISPVNDGRRADLIKAARLSSTFRNGWKLLPHQKSGVLRGLKMRRLILAFEMGLGKTLVGCVWAKAFKETYSALKIFCIAPVSLKKEWERTASDVVGISCESDKGDDKSMNMHISSWSKIPERVPRHVRNYVVVADEAHSMQSMAAGRTKDVLALVKSSRCVGVLLLTGTPMKNGKPCNIFPLLRAVGHPFGDDQKIFESFFCNGQQKQFGNGRVVWDANGSSNLKQLNAHIASHLMSMSKEQCLKNLPPKTREYRKVPVSSRNEIKHVYAMNELAKCYQSMRDGTRDDGAAEKLLGAFNRVRVVASEAKVGATVHLAQSILEKEPSIVIFSNFVAVAKEVHRKLEDSGWNGEILTGETPPKKRQLMVDNFQAGLSAAFVCTFGAGGVGLTLTAASTIILLDRPWTPGDALQAEDRVRRIGQTKPVTSIWMRAFDIDEQIDALIEEKNLTSLAVVDRTGSSSICGLTFETKSAPKVSIFRLVSSIIKN